MHAAREWCACDNAEHASCSSWRVYLSTFTNKSMSTWRLLQMLLTFALAHHHHITTANEAFSIQSDAYRLLTTTSFQKLALCHTLKGLPDMHSWSYSQMRKTCIW